MGPTSSLAQSGQLHGRLATQAGEDVLVGHAGELCRKLQEVDMIAEVHSVQPAST